MGWFGKKDLSSEYSTNEIAAGVRRQEALVRNVTAAGGPPETIAAEQESLDRLNAALGQSQDRDARYRSEIDALIAERQQGER